MKTKEELEQIKNEYTELNKKLAELSEEELKQVTGGDGDPLILYDPELVGKDYPSWYRH